MSGTLFPPEMYADLLEIPRTRKLIMTEYKSPFLSDLRPVLVAKDVTTRYTERSHSNTERIRQHILAVLRNTPGHVAFFSPSYALMDDVLGDANWLPGHIRIIDEEKRMSKSRVTFNNTRIFA